MLFRKYGISIWLDYYKLRGIQVTWCFSLFLNNGLLAAMSVQELRLTKFKMKDSSFKKKIKSNFKNQDQGEIWNLIYLYVLYYKFEYLTSESRMQIKKWIIRKIKTKPNNRIKSNKYLLFRRFQDQLIKLIFAKCYVRFLILEMFIPKTQVIIFYAGPHSWVINN